MIAVSVTQPGEMQLHLKRQIFQFVDDLVGSNTVEKRRLKFCMEELITQRNFWASVPPTLPRNTRINILGQQNHRMAKILTQRTLCPNCFAVDFVFERQPGRAITEHTLKKCKRCNTTFN